MNSPDDYSEDYTEYCAELVRIREAEEAERVNREIQEALEEELRYDPNYSRFAPNVFDDAPISQREADPYESWMDDCYRYPDDIPPSLQRFHLDDETGPGREGSNYR